MRAKVVRRKLMEQRRYEAAATIQARVRGINTRRRLAVEAAARAAEIEAAAKVLGRHMRGYIARKQYKRRLAQMRVDRARGLARRMVWRWRARRKAIRVSKAL